MFDSPGFFTNDTLLSAGAAAKAALELPDRASPAPDWRLCKALWLCLSLCCAVGVIGSGGDVCDRAARVALRARVLG